MFKGTVRSNLDPFGGAPDAELWRALELVSGRGEAGRHYLQLDFLCMFNMHTVLMPPLLQLLISGKGLPSFPGSRKCRFYP